MPTTLIGLVLFVTLLLPGFAYLVGKERAGTERRTSPFRETVAVVAASVTAELVVSVPVVLLSAWWFDLDLRLLATEPANYWKADPALIASIGAVILAFATLAAFLSTLPRVRGKLPGAYPHESSMSAWWLLFEHQDPSARKRVEVVLDDGAYLAGDLVSFNNDASDTQDRDLVLGPPLHYRAAGTDKAVAFPASATCIPATRISTMFVTYFDVGTTSALVEEVEDDPRSDAGYL